MNTLEEANTTEDGQTLFGVLDRSSDEYDNSLMNFGAVLNNRDLYESTEAPLLMGNSLDSPIFEDNNNILMIAEAAARDANQFGTFRGSSEDWSSLDFSRLSSVPSAHLCGLSFESQGAFISEC